MTEIARDRALVVGAWRRDGLGECEDCGHLSSWHYGGVREGGSVCCQDHAPCVLGCREFKGKLRPAIEPWSVFALRLALGR